MLFCQPVLAAALFFDAICYAAFASAVAIAR